MHSLNSLKSLGFTLGWTVRLSASRPPKSDGEWLANGSLWGALSFYEFAARATIERCKRAALCGAYLVFSNEALCRNTEFAYQGSNLRQRECPFPLYDLPCTGTAALEDRLEVFRCFAKPVEVKKDRLDRIEALFDPVVRVATLVRFHENGQRLESVEGEACSLRCLGDQLVDLTQCAGM